MWIPLALIALITVADVLSPASIHLGPLLVVAPALTAAFGGSRLTAFVGAVAVGALLTISAVRTGITTANHESQLASLVLISAFTVLFSRLLERHGAELRQVRSVAETAQHVVMRPLPERIGPLRVAEVYQAAADQARIGGDLYAAVRTRDATRLLIGDVRGKGLAAVDDAALLLGAFRSAAHRELPLTELQSELEATVGWGLAQPSRYGRESDEAFITALLIDIPDHAPEVLVLNSGHPPPLRLRHGHVTALTPVRHAPPIGMRLPGLPGPALDAYAFVPGDTLLLYTDGATEARDAAGRFYPLAERLAALGGAPEADPGDARNPSPAGDAAGPRDLLERVRADLVAYSRGTLDDDAALVAVRREAVVSSPASPRR